MMKIRQIDITGDYQYINSKHREPMIQQRSFSLTAII